MKLPPQYINQLIMKVTSRTDFLTIILYMNIRSHVIYAISASRRNVLTMKVRPQVVLFFLLELMRGRTTRRISGE